MTPFEIIITVLVALVVLLVGFIAYRLDILMHNAIAFFIRTGKQLSSARADMYDDVGNHYLVEILNKLDNIEDNILDDLMDIRLAQELGKTSPNVPAPLPCYAPNGICTNPQMDCINCPKRSACGTLSTPTRTVKVKGKRCELTDEELMKKINEDNKGD